MTSNLTVLILCGGRGERLRPLTESTPKPLVHINGKAILSYLLEHAQKFKITNFVIAAGYESRKIYDFFEENYTHLNVSIVDSGDVDIIERIKECQKHISNDFILLYGDTLADVSFDNLGQFHSKHAKMASISLLPFKSQFGLVEIDSDDNVTSFREKPTLEQWINIGNFYFDKEIFSLMDGYASFASFLEFLGFNNLIKGYQHHGMHITVNNICELEDAEKNIHKFELDK